MEARQEKLPEEYRFIRHIPTILIAFLIVLNVLPFVAPILLHYGFEKPANLIYTLYSLACHQKAHRSIHIYDHQCAWCMRDTFIWSAILIAAILIFRSKKSVQGISLRIAILLALPMALDGSIQLFSTMSSLFTKATPAYESTNTIRAITGAFFGTSVAMYLFPRLRKELDGEDLSSTPTTQSGR